MSDDPASAAAFRAELEQEIERLRKQVHELKQRNARLLSKIQEYEAREQ